MNDVKLKYDLMRVDHPRFYIIAETALVRDIKNLVELGKLTDTTVVPERDKWCYQSILGTRRGMTSYSTYRGCLDVEIENDYLLKVTVWDGDSFNGERTDVRYEWTFAGDGWLELEDCQKAIEAAWSRHLNSILKKRAQEKYERVKKKLSEMLLSSPQPS